MTAAATTNPASNNAAALSATAAGEARFFANAIASWYLSTIDPYAPHKHNVESRLRHPVHVVTRRILYGNVHAQQTNTNGGDSDNNNDLEALFNDDDAEIKDGPDNLTRRSAARMEAFLASCLVALRIEESPDTPSNIIPPSSPGRTAEGGSKKGKSGKDKKTKLPTDVPANKIQLQELGQSTVVGRGRANSRGSNPFGAPKIFPQIDRGDLLLRLEIYCRT